MTTKAERTKAKIRDLQDIIQTAKEETASNQQYIRDLQRELNKLLNTEPCAQLRCHPIK